MTHTCFCSHKDHKGDRYVASAYHLEVGSREVFICDECVEPYLHTDEIAPVLVPEDLVPEDFESTYQGEPE